MKIILFEDDERASVQITSAIRRRLPRGSTVHHFKPAATALAGTKPYEEQLATEVSAKGYGDATLWVTDRDLSRTPHFQGLSEAIVSKVASQLGLPICKYARGAPTDEVFERQRNWGDAQIVLDLTDINGMARKIAVLASGFGAIQQALDDVLSAEADLRTPSGVMGRVLRRPESVDHIALYGSGDQKMVSEILPFASRVDDGGKFRRRLPALFGYWLYDSILRFPGLLVNAVAAASYLDIGAHQFGQTEIRKVFRTALYAGPFADADDPHWWRRDLDQLLRKAKASTGNELASRKLRAKVSHCLDSQTRKAAGFYCMATRVPVSEENSVGPISWFPPGADLARIRRDVYEQIGPWLGL